MVKKTYKQRIKTQELENEISFFSETEHIDGYIDMKLPRKYNFNNGGFITVFQSAMYNIATKADLSKGEMKLLIYLLGTAGMDNSIECDYHILCEELNEKRPNIMKYLKGLTDRNIVLRKNGYRGGNTRYLPFELKFNYDQINYDLAYNGKTKEYSKKKEIHPEIITEPMKTIENKKPNLFNLLEDETEK